MNTNDPRLNVISLGVKAVVRPIIYVSPRYVYLRGSGDRKIARTVEVKAGLEKPLTLEKDRFSLDGKVAYTINEVEKGKKFEIIFTSVPGAAQTYQGFLRLKTNYPEKPEITIRIRGRFSGLKKSSRQSNFVQCGA